MTLENPAINQPNRSHIDELVAPPLVSVVIATYRRPEAVTRAVVSAFGQTLQNIEVIVVSEVGDDATAEALRQITDVRLKHIVNPKKRGPGVARDHGARAGRARWIAFLDDDDEWMPSKLERQLEAVGADEKTVCMTLSRVVMATGTLVQPTSPYAGDQPIDEWLFGRQSWLKGGESFLQTSSLMMPRALFDILGFGEVRHEEWELVMRAVKEHGHSLTTVNEPLVTYYTGNTYPLEGSLQWVDSVRELITPKAYSGFCLTVATHGVDPGKRHRAFLTLLSMAVRNGRPTARQLFAFALIWLLPDAVRHRVRVALGRIWSRGIESGRTT